MAIGGVAFRLYILSLGGLTKQYGINSNTSLHVQPGWRKGEGEFMTCEGEFWRTGSYYQHVGGNHAIAFETICLDTLK